MTLTTWTEKQLGEICNIYTGNSINEQVKQKKYSNLSSGYNYIATKDIDFSSKIDYENGIKIPLKEPGFKIAPKNSTLLCIEGGSAGRKIAFTSQDICFVNKLCAFVSNNNVLNEKFLFYFLQSPSFRRIFSDKVTGLIGGVSTSKLKSISIVYPSLSEQQRIVEKLDALFVDIEKEKQIAQQNLQNTKELFESELNKIVIKNDKNWTKKKLNDVCVVERGSSPRPIKKFVTTDENGVNWIRIGDCSEKHVNSTSQKITPDGAKKSRFVNVGDFIISNSMSYGKPYILNINGCIHDGWFVLRLDKTLVDTDYFYYLLSSPFVKEQYDSLATGAIVQNISSDLIKKVQFCLPPLSEQQTIVQQINVLHKQTQELEQIYTQQIADLDELKQAILKKAFNGEL